MQLAAAVILYEQVFQIEVSEGPCLLVCLLDFPLSVLFCITASM